MPVVQPYQGLAGLYGTLDRIKHSDPTAAGRLDVSFQACHARTTQDNAVGVSSVHEHFLGHPAERVKDFFPRQVLQIEDRHAGRDDSRSAHGLDAQDVKIVLEQRDPAGRTGQNTDSLTHLRGQQERSVENPDHRSGGQFPKSWDERVG